MDYPGRIVVKFGTISNRAVISKLYERPVIAEGNVHLTENRGACLKFMETALFAHT